MKPSSIIIVLIITNLSATGWLFYEKARSTKVVNQYPLIDISRNFIPQENFIVNIQPLREELNAIVEREGKDSISLYFEFLNTGANISINPNLSVWPASLIKVSIALAVMKKIEYGEWAFSSKLELTEEDKDMNYGKLFEKPTGTRLSIDNLLTEMLVASDNTARRVFLRNLDSSEIVEVMESMGLEELFTKEGKMSAKEFSRIFRLLYTSSFLQRKNSEKILALLAKSTFKDFLSSGVPLDVIFSHKFGIDRDLHTYLDSGIVYTKNRPYLITVAVQGTGEKNEESRIKKLMKEISEETYQYVTQQ